ncbi:glycosyltransferase family 4 protein [Methylorubrum populi]|uniref:glycosyltransferase family 4 protein n=1 Tax=Methylorubrum TaxID=2282523 RepID=UPI0011526E9A|nr:glycosyltransferase family 4 protein [Methylorubrum populi]QDI79176.1 glycosyltransferase family 4 protein [Methylorubrum populi]
MSADPAIQGGGEGASAPLRVTMLGLRGVPNVQGGVESHVENLALRLAELGCEVEVIVRSAYVDAASPRTWHGIRLTRLWSPRRSGIETFLHSLLGVLRAGVSRPDILHIHGIGPALFTPLARLLGLRVVVTHHSPNYEHEKWGAGARTLLRLGEQVAMRWAHGRITVSTFLAEAMRRRYGVAIEVIPNGIATPRILSSTGTLTAYGLSPGRYVLSVARIDPVKRQLDLIAALTRQAQPAAPVLVSAEGGGDDGFEPAGGEPWRLALVGGADHGTEYARAVAEAAAASAEVVMLGYQSGDALAELFSHAGAFAMVSSHEAQPIAVLEAMSYGCPLILSDIPAHHEIAPPGTIFVTPGDVAGLSARVAAIASGHDTETVTAADRARVAERHDWRAIARRTLQVYRTVHRPRSV